MKFPAVSPIGKSVYFLNELYISYFKLCFWIGYRKDEANQETLKLNETHQLMICADDADLFNENILTKTCKF